MLCRSCCEGPAYKTLLAGQLGRGPAALAVPKVGGGGSPFFAEYLHGSMNSLLIRRCPEDLHPLREVDNGCFVLHILTFDLKNFIVKTSQISMKLCRVIVQTSLMLIYLSKFNSS